MITVAVELYEFLVLRFFDFKDLSLIFDGFLFVPLLVFHDLEVLIFVSFSSDLVTVAVSGLGAASKQKHVVKISLLLFIVIASIEKMNNDTNHFNVVFIIHQLWNINTIKLSFLVF